jgi:5-formyltetrahydrofolate cyclo-ligase
MLEQVPSKTVAVYLSRDGEPGTLGLATLLLSGWRRVLVPAMRGKPDWADYDGRTKPGWEGIPAPLGSPLGPDALALADVVIIPGLAGGKDGTRLGSGCGWYDRALAHARPEAARWLLLWDDEVFDSLPREPHDELVDVLVTEQREIVTGARISPHADV